jgi:glycosyltransferase involved in cell wall biosynthesis
MRILFVDLEREWRGGQSQAWLTLRGLRERGHDAELLAVRDSPLAKRAVTAGITVHAASPRARRASAALLLRKLVAHQKYDLLHANEPHALTALWLSGSAKHAPLVISRRVAYPLGQSPLARKRYQAAERVLAVSRFVAESVLQSGVAAEKLEIIYDGVELPHLANVEARERARRLWGVSQIDLLMGCIGYLLPEKGQEFALRALRNVRAKIPNARLLLAGDGPCREKLESLAQQLGLKDGVIFAGFVEDVSQAYAAMDVFVFPSLAEPLGTSLLAAMAWGLPVLAVASGGVQEVVEDGATGLLVSQPDSGLIAAGMLRLLTHESLRMRLGGAARRKIEERFSADRMVENTIRVYEDVLKKRRSA